MQKFLISSLLVLINISAVAQFSPPAGQIGSTAIHKDSAFIAWATGCNIARGYQDISNINLGLATVGDSYMALGAAGSNAVVSLGDAGVAILTFNKPIANGKGWDFAVFENSFSDTYLELAFVEVSSDGINFFRFPATSNTQDTMQIGGFGDIDATKINNLAGKYSALYGTPFDLQELSAQIGLDINNITHVKIIDVVGCIQNNYASLDINGHKINDPWKTPFASSGFDLDAVGVIHQAKEPNTKINNQSVVSLCSVYPNPSNGKININSTESFNLEVKDALGRDVESINKNVPMSPINTSQYDIYSLEINLPKGIYFFYIYVNGKTVVEKVVVW